MKSELLDESALEATKSRIVDQVKKFITYGLFGLQHGLFSNQKAPGAITKAQILAFDFLLGRDMELKYQSLRTNFSLTSSPFTENVLEQLYSFTRTGRANPVAGSDLLVDEISDFAYGAKEIKVEDVIFGQCKRPMNVLPKIREEYTATTFTRFMQFLPECKDTIAAMFSSSNGVESKGYVNESAFNPVTEEAIKASLDAARKGDWEVS